MKNKGFTLIELLVVIALVGVLAGVVIVAINPATRLAEGRDAGRKSDIGQIATGMEAYFTRNQVYPDVVSDLVTSGDLKREPTDPSTGASYTITPAVESAADHAVYAALEADASAGCSGATPDAYFCYSTATGTGVVVCKASGSTPSATCN